MTLPRATSSEADELAATVAGLKSRLNELESAAGFGVPPIGTIVDYLGSVAPSGWVILNGATITNGRFLHPLLWDVLPSTFKSGNNIVLPDTQGLVTVHRSAAGTLNVAPGSTGGQETVTLTIAEMPSHDHTQTTHSHNYDRSTANTFNNIQGGGVNTVARALTQTSTATNSVAPTIQNTGGGGAHNNLQPYMIVVKIMKLA